MYFNKKFKSNHTNDLYNLDELLLWEVGQV